jgi:hypothetical protein
VFPLTKNSGTKTREHQQDGNSYEDAAVSQPINLNVFKKLNHNNQSAPSSG